jgi:hypothetical protein
MTIAAHFLRSVNLAADLGHPERLAHFQPTAKTVEVLKAVAFGRPRAATMVHAAYGSGKSLAAAVGALLVDGRDCARPTLAGIVERLQGVEPSLAGEAAARLVGEGRGLVIPLHGHVADLAAALLQAAGGTDSSPLAAALEEIAARAKEFGYDRVAIVWDEFGRHVEELAASGRAMDLLAVQELAEWAERERVPAVTLTLLLHQSLQDYAGHLGQTARSAWRKIEGRFEIIRFVEDSRELFGLVGDIVSKARPKGPDAVTTARLALLAERVLAAGWFRAFASAATLADLFAAAWPLMPAALLMLPTLAARVAQNERSLFTFLDTADLAHRIGIEEVYRYFAEAMRVDTGLGGTHRRWLETESARARADTPLERTLLAAACMLQLGGSGERRRLPRAALALALADGDGNDAAEIEAAIDRLIERRLLLHRQRTDDVSVWHGADIDLRTRVQEEKARLGVELDLVALLTREMPPPVLRPLRHNVEKAINRYFTGHYARAADLLRQGAAHPTCAIRPGEDGRLVFALAETAEEIAGLKTLAASGLPPDPGLVLVVPETPLRCFDAALEVAAIARLRQDRDLTGADPLVLPELNELMAVARKHLAQQLAFLLEPERGRCIVLAGGKLVPTGPGILFTEALSRLADVRFPATPCFVNDQVVRRRLSRPMVNARKKAVMGILERTGKPHLGFDGMSTPDASIYRTIVARSGLYRLVGGTWEWCPPGWVVDPGVREVWSILWRFFFEPAAEPKSVADLVERLCNPPIGLRMGVLPVLFAAGLRAFGSAVAISRDGAYLRDILPSDIEEICADPQRFTVEIVRLDEAARAYLMALAADFGAEADGVETDLVRAAFDAIERWRSRLPEAALASRSSNGQVARFQKAVEVIDDPVHTLLHRLPALVGAPSASPDVVAKIGALRQCLEGVVDDYASAAIRVIDEALSVGVDGSWDLLAKAKAWADCFPEGELRLDALDTVSRGFLARARSAADGRYTEASFARALSAMLLGKGFERWNDRTAGEFRDALRRQVERVELMAIQGERPSRAIAPLLQSRIEALVQQYRNAVGEREADSFLRSLKVREKVG